MAGARPLAETGSGVQSQHQQPSPKPSKEADLQPASPPTVSSSGPPPHIIQNVQKTFNRLYSALRSRELQILKQLDAGWKLKSSTDSFPDEDLPIIIDNELSLIEEIGKFGAVDFAKLEIDPEKLTHDNELKNDTFSYKSLEDALNQDIPHRVRCTQCGNITVHAACDDSTETSSSSSKEKIKEEVSNLSEKRIESCDSFHKLNPTQDWLNQIIYETETEPSQIVDLLEHSAIECS